MAMPPNRPPGRLLNRTLEVVLRKRPCRVLIDSEPAQQFDGRVTRAAATPIPRR
jgi:hypothetical protein